MNDARQKEVLGWLYDNCSHKWFTPWVLDPVANKAGNPPGSMSWTEITSVFQGLLKDGYIIHIAHPSGLPTFILNEMKETEWIKKIDSKAPSIGKIMGDFIIKESRFAVREVWSAIIAIIVSAITTLIISKWLQ